MKKENYILIALIILCGTIYSPFALDSTLTIRHIIWAAMTLVLCGCCCLRKKSQINGLFFVITYALIGYCIMSAISISKAENVAEAINPVLISLVSLIFFICAVQIVDKKTIIKYLTWFGLALSIFGLYEILKTPNIIEGTGIGFASGRNLWSSSLMLLAPFSLYSAAKKNKVGIISSILLAVNILFLQTRSVYVAIFVATLITALLYNNRILLAALACIIILALFHGRTTNTYSLHCRLNMWSNTVKLICDEPILGVGAGNWKLTSPRHGNVCNHFDTKIIKETQYQRAHNDFLETFAETGVIGGFCYLAIFVLGLCYTARMRDRTLAWTMRWGLIAYMVFAFFSFPKERAFQSILLFTILALIVKDSPMRYIWSTRRNFKALAFSTAIITMSIYVSACRHDSERYMRKMLKARGKGQYAKAIEIIDNNYNPVATMLGYAVTPIQHYRAEANFYLNKHDEAFADYLKAYELHPNHSCTLSNIGQYKLLQRKHKEAQYFLDKANTVFPGQSVITKPLTRLNKMRESWQ